MSIKTIEVEPVEGRRVRFPQPPFKVLTIRTEVPCTSYWLRKVKAGDVQLAKKVVKAPSKKAQE